LALVGGLGLAVGPIAGIVLLLATDWSPILINVMSSVLFAIAMPIAAAGVAYLYLDRAVNSSDPGNDTGGPGDPQSSGALLDA
ncbi:MAG: hypothetical protein HOV67_16575, partial [Kribbellaceae bacterium]|nr:hypothetical protein [Kribbellaceae bacterium]